MRITLSSYHAAEEKKMLHCGYCFPMSFLFIVAVFLTLGLFLIIHPFTSFYLYSPYRFQDTTCTLLSKMDDDYAQSSYSEILNVTFIVQDEGVSHEAQIETCIFRDRISPERAIAARNECQAEYVVGGTFKCAYDRFDLSNVLTLKDFEGESGSYKATILASGLIFTIFSVIGAPLFCFISMCTSFVKSQERDCKLFFKKFFTDSFVPGIVTEDGISHYGSYQLHWGEECKDANGNVNVAFATFINLLQATARRDEEKVLWHYKPNLWEAFKTHYVVAFLTLLFFLVNVLSVIALFAIVIIENTILIYDFIFMTPLSVFSFIAFAVMLRKCVMSFTTHYLITSERVIKCRKYWIQHAAIHYIHFDEVTEIVTDKHAHHDKGDLLIKSSIRKDIVKMFRNIHNLSTVSSMLQDLVNSYNRHAAA